MRELRVFDVRREVADEIELSASVEGLQRGLGEDRLWFRFPSWCEPWVRESAEPFVAALLPIAMVLRLPLQVDGVASPLFLHGCRQIADLYHRWDSRLVLPGLEVTALTPSPKPAGSSVGCFFSAGVDSFYTLLKNLDHECGDSRITDLIFVRGYADCPLENTRLFSKLSERLETVASTLKLRWIPAATNLKTFTPTPGPGWDKYASSQLASVALSLAGGLRKAYIPSGDTYATLSPWGSHPQVDPLWASESLEFRHDGCEAYRSQKLEWYVAKSPLAIENLHVCGYESSGLRNCGRCEKCLRTLIGLAGLGVNAPPGLFAEGLDFRRVRGLDGGDRVVGYYLRDNLRLLARHGRDPGLEGAIRQALRPHPYRWLRRRLHHAAREIDWRLFRGSIRSWAVRAASRDARSQAEFRSQPARWTLRHAWREVVGRAGRLSPRRRTP